MISAKKNNPSSKKLCPLDVNRIMFNDWARDSFIRLSGTTQVWLWLLFSCIFASCTGLCPVLNKFNIPLKTSLCQGAISKKLMDHAAPPCFQLEKGRNEKKNHTICFKPYTRPGSGQNFPLAVCLPRLPGHSFRKSSFQSSFQSLIGSAVSDFASRLNFLRLSGSLPPTRTIVAACAEQQYFSMQRGPGRASNSAFPNRFFSHGPSVDGIRRRSNRS